MATDPYASDTDTPITGTRYRVNPMLADRVNRLIAEAPPDLQGDLQHAITSGYRDYVQQQKAYANYLAGGGLAAKPGHSWHERDHGMAVDWNNVTPRAWAYLKGHAIEYGLGFPLGPKDPFHMQPVETYARANRPASDDRKDTKPQASTSHQAAAAARTPPLMSTPINPVPMPDGGVRTIVTKPVALAPPSPTPHIQAGAVPHAPGLGSVFMGGLRRILSSR